MGGKTYPDIARITIKATLDQNIEAKPARQAVPGRHERRRYRLWGQAAPFIVAAIEPTK